MRARRCFWNWSKAGGTAVKVPKFAQFLAELARFLAEFLAASGGKVAVKLAGF